LGDRNAACDSYTPPQSAPPEVSQTAKLTQPLTLLFKTELGDLTLTLDPTWAPVAVARIMDLVATGHFKNMPVHRVVPGFVVQFGDDSGDGFGHAGRSPIRCETSPVPFERYQVGMALAGRDTASSQMFVTLERYPRLDGNYAWVGRAGPEWARLAEGDRILDVSVRR
jgi:cyclophilin family peptidyl-prolyl cis-trans isomerase